MASTARTTYVLTTNGVDHGATYTRKADALKTAQSYVWAAERMERDNSTHVHVIEVRTRRTGKIVFSESVTVPALPVPAVETPSTPVKRDPGVAAAIFLSSVLLARRTVDAKSITPDNPPLPKAVPVIHTGTYYPNVPGACSIREARPLYVGDERVTVGVEATGLAYVFIGCGAAANGWGVDVSGMSYPEFYAWVNDVAANQGERVQLSLPGDFNAPSGFREIPVTKIH